MKLRDVLALIPKDEELIVEWYWYNHIEFASIIRPYGHRDELNDVMNCQVISIRTDSASRDNPIKKSILVIKIDTTEKH